MTDRVCVDGGNWVAVNAAVPAQFVTKRLDMLLKWLLKDRSGMEGGGDYQRFGETAQQMTKHQQLQQTTLGSDL